MRYRQTTDDKKTTYSTEDSVQRLDKNHEQILIRYFEGIVYDTRKKWLDFNSRVRSEFFCAFWTIIEDTLPYQMPAPLCVMAMIKYPLSRFVLYLEIY